MTVKANKFKIKNVDYEINASTLNDHEDSYFATAADVGDLSDLDTTDTSSIVDAINEVVDDVSDLADDLSSEVTRATGVEGTLSSLTTTAQSNLVAAINEVDSHADTNATAIKDLAADIADAYSSSSTYKIGELCIRNNQLYRCTTAITTAEAWNSSHWTATTIADEVENRCLFFNDVPVSATTGTILSKSDSRITADHIVTNCVWDDSSAITEVKKNN